MPGPDRIDQMIANRPKGQLDVMAMRGVAAALGQLSHADGLCALIAAVEVRNTIKPTAGRENLAEKLSELLEAAKYADERG